MDSKKKKMREEESGSNSEYWHRHRRCCRWCHYPQRSRFNIVIVSSRCDQYNASHSEETNAAVKERKMWKKNQRNKLRTEYKWILLYNKTHCVRIEPNGVKPRRPREREREGYIIVYTLHCSIVAENFFVLVDGITSAHVPFSSPSLPLPSRSIGRHIHFFSSLLLLHCIVDSLLSAPHTIERSFLYI